MKKTIYFALFLLSNIASFSQIKTTFPEVGDKDVSINPRITIELDSNYNFEFSTIDTLGVIQDSVTYDSVNNHFSYTMAYIIDSQYYSSTDSSLLVACSNGSRIFIDSIISDNKVIFANIPRLMNNRQYGLYLRDLRIIDTINNDTLVVDTLIENYFTTISENDKILYSNMNSSKGIKCTDSLLFIYNNSMPFFKNGNNVPIIELRKLLSEEVIGGQLVATDTLLSPNHSFNFDSTELKLWLDDGFEPNETYFVKSQMSSITSDTTDDSYNAFTTNGNTVLKFNTFAHSPLNQFDLPSEAKALLEDVNLRLTSNDSVYLQAPLIVDGYIFQKWQTNDNITFEDDSSNTTFAYAGCSLERNSMISPVYRKIPIDTIQIINPLHPTYNLPMSTVEVIGFKDSLGNDKYTFYRNTASGLILSASPLYGDEFKEWDADTGDDGITENNIVALITPNWGFDPNKKVTYKPTWDPPKNTPCSSVNVCAEIRMKDNDYDINDISNDVNININYSGNKDHLTFVTNGSESGTACKTFSTPFPTPFNVSFDIDIPDCYEIVRYRLQKGNLNIGTYDDYESLGNALTTQSFFVNIYDTDCEVKLLVDVRRKLNYIVAEARMEDLSKLPYYSRLTYIDIRNSSNSNEGSPQTMPDGSLNPKIEYSNGKIIKVTTVFYAKCGNEYRAIPVAKEEKGYLNNIWVCPNPLIPETMNLTCLSVINDPTWGENVLKFTTNEKITYIRHDFKSGFKIEVIGYLKLDGAGAYDMFDADLGVPFDDQPLAAMGSPGNSRGSSDPMGAGYIYSTTSIKIKFNKAVDESTLYNNIKIYDNAVNSNFRLDQKALRDYTFRNSSHGGSDVVGGSNSNEVIIRLFSNDNDHYEIPHMTGFIVNFTDDIKSTNNESLTNFRIKMLRKTEYPSYEVKVTKMENDLLKYIYDVTGINITQDNFTQYYANYTIVENATKAIGIPQQEFKQQIPSEGNYTTLKGQTPTYLPSGNGLILNTIPRLTPNTYVGMGYHGVVDKYGTLIDNLINVAKKVTEVITLITPASWGIGKFLQDKGEQYMTSGWWNPFPNDETISAENYRFNETDNLWGCNYLYHYTEQKSKGLYGLKLYFRTVLK